MQRGIVALVFRCEIVGETPHPSAEVDEIAWLMPDQLSRLSEAYRIRLLDALDSGAPHVRAHDGAQLIEPRR